MKASQVLLSLSVFCSTALYAGVPPYAGCTEADYVTVTEPEITVAYQGSSYEPACIKIKKGTKVTISASQKHPLQAAEDFDGVINPLRKADGDHLTAQSISPEVMGFYGYYCTRHGDPESGHGMGGMIWVVE